MNTIFQAPARAPRALLCALLCALLGVPGLFGGCRCGDDVFTQLVPSLRVNPPTLRFDGVAVTQDLEFSVQALNASSVSMELDGVSLSEDSDPAFEIISAPEGIDANDSETIVLRVRPIVKGTIEAVLIVDAEDAAEPNLAEVPITVNADNFGAPELVVTPEAVEFDTVGQNDVVRATVTLANQGNLDLVIDSATLTPEDEGDASIKLTTQPPANLTLASGETASLDLVFAPTDTEDHNAILTLTSNDPDGPVEVPVHGRGKDCPIAVAKLLEDPEDIEPLDTIRMIGDESYPVTPETEITSYQWVMDLRPVGSSATLKSPNIDRTELDVDLAGEYQIHLEVEDSIGVRSCNDAVIKFFAIPTEELHLQLVWDHPTADLDLHLLREGGEPFNHDGDAYFSNKKPEWFPEFPQSNPSLDVDDDKGYGPENINIETPIDGSRWTVMVHYWDKQTDGDPYLTATLRVFAKGQEVASLNKVFEQDEQLWSAAEIVWPTDELDLPTINPIGTVEAYPRPF